MSSSKCKCGSRELFRKDNANQKGLYCSKCGKWIKWLNKDEANLYSTVEDCQGLSREEIEYKLIDIRNTLDDLIGVVEHLIMEVNR